MTMITPSYLGETIEYSSLHACRSTLEDPTIVVNDALLVSVGVPQTISTTPLGTTLIEGNSTGAIPVATFQDTDPSEPDADAFPTADYTATIAWGDGTSSTGTIQQSVPAGSFNVSGSHSYTEEGSFNPIVTIKDVGGAPALVASNTTVSVADAPLTGDISPGATTISAESGVNTGTVLVGKFTDADPNGGSGVGPQPDYQAQIFWGDGSVTTVSSNFIRASVTPAGVVIFVTGNHTYAQAGAYSIFIVVTDIDGTSPGTRQTAFVFDTRAIVTP